MQNRLGILVGMQVEADLASHLSPAVVEISGATYEGAKAALERLIEAGVDSVLSFGVAAGLDPIIKAGTILLPYSVMMGNRDYMADPALRLRLGSENSNIRIGALYHSNSIITSAHEKQEIFTRTGCIAADMESGLVAQYCQEKQIPFAVLRVICDSAERDLPPLVDMALTKQGKFDVLGMIKSLLVQPKQIKDLLGVGKDMGLAYWNLNRFVRHYQ